MGAFLHFSPSEVEDGLSYARENHGVCLNREMLKSFADHTGIKWAAAGKRPGDILRVKRIVLLDAWERHGIDSVRRDVYSAAISHMFGVRSREATKARKMKRSESPNTAKTRASLPPATYAFGESGQGEFLFGTRK